MSFIGQMNVQELLSKIGKYSCSKPVFFIDTTFYTHIQAGLWNTYLKKLQIVAYGQFALVLYRLHRFTGEQVVGRINEGQLDLYCTTVQIQHCSRRASTATTPYTVFSSAILMITRDYLQIPMLSHGIYIRWQLRKRCAHTEQSLSFDLFKAFDGSSAVTILFFFLSEKTYFPSCVRKMYKVTNFHKQLGVFLLSFSLIRKVAINSEFIIAQQQQIKVG